MGGEGTSPLLTPTGRRRSLTMYFELWWRRLDRRLALSAVHGAGLRIRNRHAAP